jgi:hypothetical protein
MNAAQSPYNPVSDGLPALIWECLRRNAQFQRGVKELTTGTKTLEREFAENQFSRVVLEAMRSGTLTRKVLHDSWPLLPVSLRDKLATATDKLRETPSPVHPPPLGSTKPPFSLEDQRVLQQFLTLWEKHEIVALPRVHLDERHRRESKAAAVSFVPKVVRFPLGAEMQWTTFLRVEHYVHNLRMRQVDADALTAWEHLAPKSFRSFVGDRRSRKGLDEAHKALAKHRKEFERRTRAVEAAVDKVFPTFAVFDL